MKYLGLRYLFEIAFASQNIVWDVAFEMVRTNKQSSKAHKSITQIALGFSMRGYAVVVRFGLPSKLHVRPICRYIKN